VAEGGGCLGVETEDVRGVGVKIALGEGGPGDGVGARAVVAEGGAGPRAAQPLTGDLRAEGAAQEDAEELGIGAQEGVEVEVDGVGVGLAREELGEGALGLVPAAEAGEGDDGEEMIGRGARGAAARAVSAPRRSPSMKRWRGVEELGRGGLGAVVGVELGAAEVEAAQLRLHPRPARRRGVVGDGEAQGRAGVAALQGDPAVQEGLAVAAQDLAGGLAEGGEAGGADLKIAEQLAGVVDVEGELGDDADAVEGAADLVDALVAAAGGGELDAQEGAAVVFAGEAEREVASPLDLGDVEVEPQQEVAARATQRR
jgi:hypothetical protein